MLLETLFVLPLMSLALGSAVPSTLTEKRNSDLEAVALVNCETQVTKFAYYPNNENTAGRYPDSEATAIGPAGKTYTAWEGNAITGYWGDGNSFVSNILPGTWANFPSCAVVGTARDAYGSWNCFKGNQVVQYQSECCGACRQIYYCYRAEFGVRFALPSLPVRRMNRDMVY
jgi:hypothetical protein